MNGSAGGAAARRLPLDPAAREEREPVPAPPRATAALLLMYGMIALFMTWLAWRLVYSGPDGSAVPSPWTALAVLAFWLGTLSLIAAYLWMQLGTELDADGVSQRTLRGRRTISWASVVSVDHGPYGMLFLSDGRRQVAISAIVYSNADELYAWIAERLHEAGSPAARMV
ncbi:MAG TPA: hypothetical protein VF192_08275 [Longimicrobiales bacterium]